jgi:DeoR family transcriptional regulator of aga operon
MKHASKVIVLMDATKVGASRLFVPFAQPGDVDLVIMDTDPDGVVAEAARVGGGRSRVVEVAR